MVDIDRYGVHEHALLASSLVTNYTTVLKGWDYLFTTPQTPPWFTVPACAIPSCLSRALIVNQIHKHCVSTVPPHPRSHAEWGALDWASVEQRPLSSLDLSEKWIESVGHRGSLWARMLKVISSDNFFWWQFFSQRNPHSCEISTSWCEGHQTAREWSALFLQEAC